MASTYRVTDLATEAVELMNDAQLRNRFAPELMGDSQLVDRKEANEWLSAFLSSSVFQKGFGVAVEKVDAREVFETELAEYKVKKAELAKTKARQDAALIEVLKEITVDEVKEGAIHKVSETAKKELSIVGLYLAKATPSLEDLIANASSYSLPAHVVKELKGIRSERKKAADKRKS